MSILENVEVQDQSENQLLVQKQGFQEGDLEEQQEKKSKHKKKQFLKIKEDESNIQYFDKNQMHLKLPKTRFKQRFIPTRNETQLHPKISSDIYKQQFEKFEKSNKKFKIHSQPISLHGEQHLGHLFNLTLKDFINRFQRFQNSQVQFDVGFQSGNKMLENEAIRNYWEKNQKVEVLSDTKIREITGEYKSQQLQKYVKNIERWGIMCDLTQSYYTQDKLYEKCVLDAFQQMVDRGVVGVDYKPFLWSVWGQNVIEEEEVNLTYEKKPGIFTVFDVIEYGNNQLLQEECPNLKFITFVPEAWSLTSVQGLSLNDQENYYIICQVGEEFNTIPFEKMDHFVISQERYRAHKKFFKERSFKVKFVQLGENLLNFNVKNPLNEEVIPVIKENDMRTHFGSGVNPIAPAYYIDDLIYSKNYGFSKMGHINENGEIEYSQNEELFNSKWNKKSILKEDANKSIKQFLEDKSKLVQLDEEIETVVIRQKKTNERILVRSQIQVVGLLENQEKESYFQNMDQKASILGQVEDPAYEHFQNIIKEKKEWQISSIHKTGLPMPVFLDTKKQKIIVKSDIIEHFNSLVQENGKDIWYTWEIEDLLPKKFNYQKMAKNLIKLNLVFDDMFVNGLSWYVMQEKDKIQNMYQKKQISEIQMGQNQEQNLAQIEENNEEEQNIKIQQKIQVLEGVDQQDQWIQGVVLSQILMQKEPFFDVLKFHSVIKYDLSDRIQDVEEHDDEKLSKMQDQPLEVENLINGSRKMEDKQMYGLGVDNIRYWIASQNSKELEYELIESLDRQFDEKIQEVNFFRKVIWELMGVIDISNQRDGKSTVELEQTDENHFSFINKFMYWQLQFFAINMKRLYMQQDFKRITELSNDFLKNYVFDFYIHSTKNDVIGQFQKSKENGTFFIYKKILNTLLVTLSPILPHNCQNIYEQIHYRQNETIFEENWPEQDSNLLMGIKDNLPLFSLLFDIRSQVWKDIKNNSERLKKFSDLQYELVFVVQNLFGVEIKVLNQIGSQIERFFGIGNVNFEVVEDNRNRSDTAISSSQYKTVYKQNELNFKIKLYMMKDKFQCVRCFRYNVQEENKVCGDCIDYINYVEPENKIDFQGKIQLVEKNGGENEEIDKKYKKKIEQEQKQEKIQNRMERLGLKDESKFVSFSEQLGNK